MALIVTYQQSNNKMEQKEILIAADLRWPVGSGIGLCQQEYLSRKPVTFTVLDSGSSLRIGNPLSPLSISPCFSISNEKCNVFWSPGFVPPAYSVVPTVVTVHDLTHLHFYSKLHAKYYELILKPLYKKCSSIICVSEHTRNEFLEWSGMPEDKVQVIYNGVSPKYNRNIISFKPGYPYIFYPGNKREYKNIAMLLHAFHNSILPKHGVKLVMTGASTSNLQAIIYRLNLSNHVVFLGFVPDEFLPSIYHGAEFTSFISLYEGFGLPIVESMAVGTPVLTSNISSMPEIAGNAAQLVDPLSLDEITTTLNTLLLSESLRMELSAKGLSRAEFFSWDKSSNKTWNLIEDLACLP